MKRSPYWKHPGRRGFTLVELLVVMGIIGLLVMLLMPAVNHAIIAVYAFKTANIISQIDTALTAYQADHGEYPASPTGRGYENLDSCLTGAEEGEESYYQGKLMEDGGIADAFKPQQYILYFRHEPSTPAYNVFHNPTSDGREGFTSKVRFEDLVKLGESGGTTRWVRPDYLLISAGPDRIFGYVKDEDGELVLAGRDDAGAMCDDICNFKYE
ncbi:MAG TPA: type II secretion system protein [Phycisphaerae bacterium]|nr:type II secretion system protein [Phycisphaerae bacterium]